MGRFRTLSIPFLPVILSLYRGAASPMRHRRYAALATDIKADGQPSIKLSIIFSPI
jgi:hypothetical protein